MLPTNIHETVIKALAVSAVQATLVVDGDAQTRQLTEIRVARDYLEQVQTQPRWEPVTDESMTRTIEIVTSGLDEYEGCRLCRLVQPQQPQEDTGDGNNA
jgi:hypothetical protein